MFLEILILILLVVAGIWAVMTRSLLRSAMGLALVSAILTLIMFRMGANLAAVFELSVCAGLIPVLFISIISLTHPQSHKEAMEHMKLRFARFWGLPLLVLVLGLILALVSVKFKTTLPLPESETDASRVLWQLRPFDLLGQVIILFTGVFGVVILFKERKKSG